LLIGIFSDLFALAGSLIGNFRGLLARAGQRLYADARPSTAVPHRSELRRPLGITIVGGLLMSQMLTLYTTPVVYLYLDRLSLWWRGLGRHGVARVGAARARRGAAAGSSP
jgi:hypothetical protein